jgi:hypothetical protein
MILFCPNNKLPHKIFLSERNLIFFGYSSGNWSVQHGEQRELQGVVMLVWHYAEYRMLLGNPRGFSMGSIVVLAI